MAKFYGQIGYSDYQETQPGIFEPVITERNYSGDILRNSRRLQSTEHANDNVNISNEFSIVADQYAYTHIYNMVYLKYNGVCWKVSDVEVQHPRLLLTIGGIYNENEDSTS